MKELSRFRRRLGSVLGTVNVVVLFGSQATGRTRPESDVDILIVSPAFRGRSFIQRAAQVDPAWDLPYPVDFLCYTPEEFERLRQQVSIVRVALEEGQPVEG